MTTVVRGVLLMETAAEVRVHSAERELAALVADVGALRQALTRLTELACVIVPGAGAVSCLRGSPAGPDLVAGSSQLAQVADGAQIMSVSGPAFDAVRSRRPVVSVDLRADARWPRLADHLPAHPVELSSEDVVASCVAVPILLTLPAGTPTGGMTRTIGVLTVYSSSAPVSLGDTAVLAAELLASRAASLMASADQIADLVRTTGQLREALISRAVIDQAKGMIMRERRCTAEQAFQVLRAASNASNLKVRDLAERMVQGAIGH